MDINPENLNEINVELRSVLITPDLVTVVGSYILPSGEEFPVATSTRPSDHEIHPECPIPEAYETIMEEALGIVRLTAAEEVLEILEDQAGQN